MSSGVRPIRIIVVGVDGSEPARRALAWALSASEAFGGEVVAVHASGLLEHRRGEQPSGRLSDLVGDMADASSVRFEVDAGSAEDVLLRVVDAEHADLVVVGRRGAGEPCEFELGSVSRGVASRCTVPVVVVPAL